MEFDVTPYYDDFETAGGARDENYLRILFKPGYAVQARELTQIQSIVQNQIKQFGNHVFKDGSPVIGGQLSVNFRIPTLLLQPNDDVVIGDFNSKLIINSVGALTKQAYVLAVDDSIESSTVAGALMVRYLSGDQFTNSDAIEVSLEPTITSNLLSANATTSGSIVTINDGVFYVKGFFIQVDQQTIVLDSQSNTPSYRIGLEFDESLISETDDTNLLDPAQESFNYQAPGGDRYQITLTLTKRTLDSEDETTFFELLRVENGLITKEVRYPIYSEINKTLARRTFDQSGSYTVRPFRVTASDDEANSSNVVLNIEPGKAYVKGFEYETVGMTKVSIPKARSTSNSTDYDLSLEYGNFFVAQNVHTGNSGLLSIDTLPKFDIHLVPSANINTSNRWAYANSAIGTARLKNIEYESGNRYYVYLTDMVANPFIVTNATTTAANTQVINVGSYFPSVDDCYKGVNLTIIAGTNSGESRKILQYNGAHRYIVVDTPFPAVCTTSTRLTFKYEMKDAESLVVTPTAYSGNVYFNQNTDGINSNSGIFTCMDVAAVSKDTSGFTYTSETNLNKLIFRLPESYIVKGNTSGVGFKYRKSILNKSSTGNTISLQSPSDINGGYEKFTYGVNNQLVSNILANSTCFLVVKDKKTSNLSNGQVLTFFDGGNRIYADSDGANSITIYTTSNATFTADIIITVEVLSAETQSTRTKTLKGNSSNTILLTTDTPSSALITVANTSGVKVDNVNAHIWFSSGGSLSNLKIVGKKQPLYIPDVISIRAIYDSGSTSYAPNSVNAIDVTNRYVFDSGHTDNWYDHSTLTLRAGSQPPSGQVVVMCEFYEHSGSGYFSVDSYSSDAYANNKIPYYNSPIGGVYSLRDCVDFRPTRLPYDAAGWIFTVGTSADVIFTGTKMPYPYYTMTIENYDFYLPRIDRLVLTQEGNFEVIQGTPSNYPVVPSDSTDAMALYNITIPPYTLKSKDILLDYIDNRRYTMKDIGNLRKRIENLEYYTSLSLLESKSASQSIQYLDGTEKEKYGIVVDQFAGFDVVDNRSPDLLCNITDRELSPYKIIEQVDFTFSSGTGAYKRNAKTYSLSYSEEACVVQNCASRSESVQPFDSYYFGTITLTPETDFWYSTSLSPERVIPANDTSRQETTPVENTTVPITGSPVVAGETNTLNFTVTQPWTGGVTVPVTFGHTYTFAGFGGISVDSNWIAKNIQNIEDSSSQTLSAQVPVNTGASIQLGAGGSFVGGGSTGVSGTNLAGGRIVNQ